MSSRIRLRRCSICALRRSSAASGFDARGQDGGLPPNLALQHPAPCADRQHQHQQHADQPHQVADRHQEGRATTAMSS